MENIIYMIEFVNRSKNKIYPAFYIGVKTNCILKDNKIFVNEKREYWGSSKDKIYLECLKYEEKKVHILKKCKNVEEALDEEIRILSLYKADSNILFFNKFIGRSNFNDPKYATYKHIETGKITRLLRNDEKVLNGEYVGVTKGNKLTEEQRKKIGLKGEKNPFFGKKHPKEIQDKIIKSYKKTLEKKPELKKIQSEIAKKNFSGISLSKEHKMKIGRKGFIMLKNILTDESIRIKRDEVNNYDKTIWLNPFKVKMIKEKNENKINN